MKTGKVVLVALAGLAVGAIAGILFAPRKGSKTRRQIIDKGEDLVEDLKLKFDDVYDSLTDKLEKTFKGSGHDGEAKYQEARKDVKNTASESRYQV
jgi:gas vesicle protein